MRPENIAPMRAMITMWVRRSPNCETVLDRLKKVIPRFFRRLNTTEFIHLQDEVNDGGLGNQEIRESGDQETGLYITWFSDILIIWCPSNNRYYADEFQGFVCVVYETMLFLRFNKNYIALHNLNILLSII